MRTNIFQDLLDVEGHKLMVTFLHVFSCLSFVILRSILFCCFFWGRQWKSASKFL